ncbi:MAG: hypothetical protein J6X03_01290 [Bacilli bacterium]|nr:hypothetical protein [Bacilli bacterium]
MIKNINGITIFKMTLKGLLKSYAKYSIPPMAKYGRKIYVAIQIDITKNKNEINNSLFLNDEFIIKYLYSFNGSFQHKMHYLNNA